MTERSFQNLRNNKIKVKGLAKILSEDGKRVSLVLIEGAKKSICEVEVII